MKLFKKDENFIFLIENGYLYCEKEIEKKIGKKLLSYLMNKVYSNKKLSDTMIVIFNSDNYMVKLIEKEKCNYFDDVRIFYRRHDIIKDKDFKNHLIFFNVVDLIRSNTELFIDCFPYVEKTDSKNYRALFYHFQCSNYNHNSYFKQDYTYNKKKYIKKINLISEYAQLEWKDENIIILFFLLSEIYKKQFSFILEKEIYQYLANVVHLLKTKEFEKAFREEQNLISSLLNHVQKHKQLIVHLLS